jgi:hypothetical protein
MCHAVEAVLALNAFGFGIEAHDCGQEHGVERAVVQAG